jgi:hypothetical protein
MIGVPPRRHQPPPPPPPARRKIRVGKLYVPAGAIVGSPFGAVFTLSPDNRSLDRVAR